MTPRPHSRLLAASTGLVVLTGLGWAILSWRMAAGGELPGSLKGAIPVAPEDWFRLQALWVVPVLLGVWLLMGALATALSTRAGGEAPFAATLGAVGLGWAGPLQTFQILPELVIYEVWGVDSLRAAMPVLAMLTLAGCWFGTSMALTLVQGLIPGRARLVAVVVLLVGALAGGPFLR